ncbi:hypothetical protein SDC9_110777 [bioreactor metagenome]|uniref:Uncharacterized protein n=1 Tax=bioreactor metagenome TaxID=1076179 RepID=A0A645BKY8_9ZZZZ
MIEYPAYETGAVKGGGRTAAAPNVGIAEVFLRFRDDSGKLFVLQRLRRNVIIRVFLFRGSVGIGRRGKQIRPVSQGGHVHRVHADFFLAHDEHGQMGQVFVVQLHVADVIVVRDFISVGMGVALRVRPGVRFRAVAYLNLHVLRQLVLLFKQHGERVLYRIQRPFAAVPSGQEGDQYIGVMANFINVIAVFIITGVQRFIVLHLVLEVRFHCGIRGLRAQHGLIRGGIGGNNDAGQPTLQ